MRWVSVGIYILRVPSRPRNLNMGTSIFNKQVNSKQVNSAFLGLPEAVANAQFRDSDSL